MKSLLAPKTAIFDDGSLTLKRLLALRAVVQISLFMYMIRLVDHFTIQSIVAFLLVASAVYSLMVWLRFKNANRPLTSRALAVQLIWDGVVILLFVCVTGRSANPFIYYWLVIIAISASLFREKIVWMFCLSGIFAYSVLMYLDSSQHMAHMNKEFRSHLLGMWINFVASAILISFFISRLTAALKNRERALALAREEILKNEQLIGIGTLAASTVHSFGTPLSTIAMAAGEIDALHGDSGTSNYTAIIKTQIERCKNTMTKLTLLASPKEGPYQDILLATIVAEIEEHFMLMNSEPMPVFNLKNANLKRHLPGGILLLHAIINLIDNAIQAAKTQVYITLETSETAVKIFIEDDGDGLNPALLDSLGEVITASKTGLGIGFLLANSTVERLGGSVRFCNPINSTSINSDSTPNKFRPRNSGSDSLSCVLVTVPLQTQEVRDVG